MEWLSTRVLNLNSVSPMWLWRDARNDERYARATDDVVADVATGTAVALAGTQS